MSYKLTSQTYKTLYAKYYLREPEELIQYALDKLDAEDLSGLNILDACGGDGRLSRACLRKSAKSVKLVDNSPMMLNLQEMSYYISEYDFEIINKDINDYLLSFFDTTRIKYHDIVFCQQAANYWLTTTDVVRKIANTIVTDGLLIFNTFNRRPPRQIIPKSYKLKGPDGRERNYTEISYSVDDDRYKNGDVSMVHHIQICEGLAPYYTSFTYLSPEQWNRVLSPFFNVKRHRNGKTDIYVCQHCKPIA